METRLTWVWRRFSYRCDACVICSSDWNHQRLFRSFIKHWSFSLTSSSGFLCASELGSQSVTAYQSNAKTDSCLWPLSTHGLPRHAADTNTGSSSPPAAWPDFSHWVKSFLVTLHNTIYIYIYIYIHNSIFSHLHVCHNLPNTSQSFIIFDWGHFWV